MTATLDLTRTRGDTYPIRMTISNPDGTPMDLTDKQVLLTVNSEEDPQDTSTQIFQITGTVTDAAAGQVEFVPTAEQVDNVGTFYYDIELTDIEVPEVPAEPEPPSSWVASGTPGADVSMDGTEFWYGSTSSTFITMQYAERDGVTVAEMGGNDTSNYLNLHPWPGQPVFKDGVFQFRGLVYLSASVVFQLRFESWNDRGPNNYTTMTMPDFGEEVTINRQWTSFQSSNGRSDYATIATAPSWYRFLFQLDFREGVDGTGYSPSIKVKVWGKDETEPVDWMAEALLQENDPQRPIPSGVFLRLRRLNTGQNVEIAEFSYEEVTS